jgi:hypothetical protein
MIRRMNLPRAGIFCAKDLKKLRRISLRAQRNENIDLDLVSSKEDYANCSGHHQHLQ